MPEAKEYDVIILGTGPAGLQAAIHAARKKVSVLVLGKETRSSVYHAHVENFCCIFNISGEEILKTGRQQAVNFGAELLDEDVLNILPEEENFKVISESGIELLCKALIVATGTTRNKLGVSGEKEFLGSGVSYCVECDANFFKDIYSKFLLSTRLLADVIPCLFLDFGRTLLCAMFLFVVKIFREQKLHLFR